MKDLIVIMGTVVLGCYIFELMVGDGNSLKSSSEHYFRELLSQIRG
ncbi:MAG: hypothetical protein SPI74_00440 [Eubacterium sp.]|nr:hypothetical protein [Eubacterium sp.]